MKILFLTHLNNTDKIRNDYMNDSLLHGLRELYGSNVVDYPGAWYMYKDEVIKRKFNYSNLWGNGFTYYDQLKNFDQIDRNNIKEKIKSNYFDYVIYGSFPRSQIFLEDVKKSKSKIILIDGEDNQDLSKNTDLNLIYFKRELNQNVKNVYPINLSIPKKKIINNLNMTPKYLLAPLIPHRYKTYIYKNENDYYNMWQNSIFGISYVHGGWWEAVRYYEMLMNGCIPLIQNLEKCPEKTLVFLPKKDLLKANDDYSWVLNQYNPFSIYKKKFLDVIKILNYINSNFKTKYNSKTFIKKFPEVNNLREKLIDYSKNFLSTESIAKYIINESNKFYG